jgi:hypothetical protein
MRNEKWYEMGIKGAVFLSVILVSVMFIIIDSTVAEGNLRSVLIGLSVGITVLVVKFIPGKLKINFIDKKRR